MYILYISLVVENSKMGVVSDDQNYCEQQYPITQLLPVESVHVCSAWDLQFENVSVPSPFGVSAVIESLITIEEVPH